MSDPHAYGLWEILVPTQKRLTTPPPTEARALLRWRKRHAYTTRYHRVWDQRVRDLTGGLTILTPARGQWVAPDGVLFSERMIPVRIATTRAIMLEIVEFTLTYYDQLAVLCYKISDDVILRSREEDA
jgi:hypothetical protein